MANRGIEPPLPGHTEEEAFGWVIGSIEQLLPKAEECGVVLGLENHWGLGRTPEDVERNEAYAALAPGRRAALSAGV